MSIIHDALKKVQQSMKQNSSSPTPSNSPEEVVEVLPSSLEGNTVNQASSWPLMILMLLIVVGCAVSIVLQIQKKNPKFLSKIHFNALLKTPVKSVAKPQNTAPAEPLAQVTVPASISASVQNPLPITLNVQGIMASGGHNIALINNRVHEEGDVINGIKILKISLESITVEHDGKQETVDVRR